MNEASAVATWADANDRYLTAAVAWIRALLTARAARSTEGADALGRRRGLLARWCAGRQRRRQLTYQLPAPMVGSSKTCNDAAAELTAIGAELECAGLPPPAIEQLVARLGLTCFERDMLLLCLAVELDPRLGELCGLVGRNVSHSAPTFAVAMSLFDSPDWGALPAEGSLRRWRLITVHREPGDPLVSAPLQIDERLLHLARGIACLDERLACRVSAVDGQDVDTSPEGLLPEAEALADLCRQSALRRAPMVALLAGSDGETKRQVALAAARSMNHNLYRLAWEQLPLPPSEWDEFTRLWQRESRLLELALLIDIDETSPRPSAEPSGRLTQLKQLLSFPCGPIFVATIEPWQELAELAGPLHIRSTTWAEQRTRWASLLPGEVANRRLIDELACQFSLSWPAMRQALAAAQQIASDAPQETDGIAAPTATAERGPFGQALWRACRVQSRPRLEGLAERVESSAAWSDLVVGGDCLDRLRQIAGQVRNRWRVYHEWGLQRRLQRGLGISALFAGESGTGKTLGAEVLAHELDLDLYRVDLSSVVSKYIGETEKRLRRLFDAFESCGAILFFDECDALFGKRSEVRDSHDRYANIEIDYLLQRLENYRGLALLATNRRGALDPAFLRRLRFVVDFPPPTVDQRRCIWRRLLPADGASGAPLAGSAAALPVASLDYDRLARFNLTGGHIFNAALNAAFRAADRADDPRVTMGDVLSAVRDEHVKLGRPVDEAAFLESISRRERVA